jgi:hypothetical protein
MYSHVSLWHVDVGLVTSYRWRGDCRGDADEAAHTVAERPGDGHTSSAAVPALSMPTYHSLRRRTSEWAAHALCAQAAGRRSRPGSRGGRVATLLWRIRAFRAMTKTALWICGIFREKGLAWRSIASRTIFGYGSVRFSSTPRMCRSIQVDSGSYGDLFPVCRSIPARVWCVCMMLCGPAQ